MAVYNFWQSRMKEAWHQLSGEEQQSLLGKVSETLNAVGGKELILCVTSWSNAEWTFFGVEEFPDAEAVQRHEDLLLQLNWGRYIEARSTLGTKFALPGAEEG
jgi:hypothetical protein